MLVLRLPRLDEHSAMSALCLQSKAHWGYDNTFMDNCRDELTITKTDLETGLFQVADIDSKLAGVAQVTLECDTAALELLYVSPLAMGQNVGRALFVWAIAYAKSNHALTMNIIADPHAQQFYEHMGASQIGEYPSGSIPGRMLPQLSLRLMP